MNRILFSIFIFFITSCSVNSIDNQDLSIEGAWKHSFINSVSGDINSEKTPSDGDIWIFNGETVAIYAHRNGGSIGEEPKVKTGYRIVGNSIEIGSYSFRIQKHEQDELVLDYGDVMYFKKWQ